MKSGQEGESKAIISLPHVRPICLTSGIPIFKVFLSVVSFTVYILQSFDTLLGHCPLSVV